MPRGFLNRADRERLSRFPITITDADRIVYFSLTAEDLELTSQHRSTHRQLGCGLLLCSLRYLGYFPDSLTELPSNLIVFVADQLGVPADTLTTYVARPQNRWDLLALVRRHLGFRRFKPPDREQAVQWLGERALENERPSRLLQQLCERLYQQKLVRPSVTTLESIVIQARAQAWERSYDILVAPLSAKQRTALARLLLPREEGETRALLTWLNRPARTANAKQILQTIEKLQVIRQWRVAEWDVAALPTSRLKWLARLARYSSTQALERREPERDRQVILAAFLLWMHETILDQLVDLFDECWADIYRRAKQDLRSYQLQQSESLSRVIGYFHNVADILLDRGVEDEAVRPTIYEYVPAEQIQKILTEIEQHRFGKERADVLDFVDSRYSYIRRFSPKLLAALTLKTRRADSLLEAVSLLDTLNTDQDTSRELQNAPIDFVPGRWRSRVVHYDGSVKRRAYELCALSELRDNLRAGEIWLDGSRRYADLESYLIPREQWESERAVFCEMVNLPADGQQYIAAQTQALQTELSAFDTQLTTLDQVRLENDKLVLTPLKKQRDDDVVEQLSKQVGMMLPTVYTGELLAEVDRWCGFSQELTHAGGSKQRPDEMADYLYAILLAGASNIDLERMAELANLSHSRLVWYANWFIREETVQRATDVMVNFHLDQPFSQVWGSGTLSSSDGQRFPVSRDVLRSAPLPRYFGYGRGLSFITWVADQYSQYGIRVTPPTMREATYVLDAILENESDLSIEMHTTDTAGYTDLIFALFDLLGMQFAPRLKDIGDRKLYCPDKAVTYKNIAALLTTELKSDLYTDDYDEMLRVVASLKMGRVTASTLVSKLQAYPRQHHLTRVLQEYGKLVRTRFILRYLTDEAYQRIILKQLNKGESVHRLRRFLLFDHLGQLRKSDMPSIVNQAACLNLVTNAMVVWNTVYMQAAVESLRADGMVIDDSQLERLSPIRYRHIFPYGRFFFNIQQKLEPTGLRPLRGQK